MRRTLAGQLTHTGCARKDTGVVTVFARLEIHCRNIVAPTVVTTHVLGVIDDRLRSEQGEVSKYTYTEVKLACSEAKFGK